MKFLSYAVAAVSAFAAAQAQNSQSLCDKYTTALLKTNNASNQLTVLTLVVNTALIGNYPNPVTPKNNVTGILNPGMYGGENVNLLPYFSGALKSTNRNNQAVALNFLDGGGADPLKQNKAANDTTSNQYTLVTHLYEIFGSLLGCSMQNSSSVFKNYQGNPSMSEVHRFMNLNRTQMNYFIQEVGLSATSFGVSSEDAMTVGNALNTTFNYRCSPPASLGGGAANYSQSVCVAPSCPEASPSNCTQGTMSYPNGTEGAMPVAATTSGGSSGSSGSSSSGSSGSSSSGSSGSSTSTSGMNGAQSQVVNIVGALALAAAGVVAIGL